MRNQIEALLQALCELYATYGLQSGRWDGAVDMGEPKRIRSVGGPCHRRVVLGLGGDAGYRIGLLGENGNPSFVRTGRAEPSTVHRRQVCGRGPEHAAEYGPRTVDLRFSRQRDQSDFIRRGPSQGDCDR